MTTPAKHIITSGIFFTGAIFWLEVIYETKLEPALWCLALAILSFTALFWILADTEELTKENI